MIILCPHLSMSPVHKHRVVFRVGARFGLQEEVPRPQVPDKDSHFIGDRSFCNVVVTHLN